MRIITLTTDFGLGDWFVAAMKGVILGIEPRAHMVDITHEIPAGDIRAGAFVLAASYHLFPRHTVHVAIVDPGVGSSRAPIAVQTADYFFVGPDNGVLSLALARETIRSIRRLENTKLFRHSVSRTFHGRDIFAPVAAHLSKGIAIQTVGPELARYTRLALPIAKLNDAGLTGEIIYIDHFGNAITNVGEELLKRFDPRRVEINLGKARKTFALGQFYQAAKPGRPLGIVGSSGLLEIALNGGDAAKTLRLKIGDSVSIRVSSINHADETRIPAPVAPIRRVRRP